MAVGVIYAGAQAPEGYSLDLTPGTSGVDLSTVTAAELHVQKPDGQVAVWAVAITNQTSTTITLTHDFVVPAPMATPPVPSDVAAPGPYVIVAILTIPSGIVRSAPRLLPVPGQFEV